LNFSTRKYNYLIVDSQLDDVKELQKQFENYPDYHCVGIARNKDEAVNLILDQHPHIVFLNTEIGEGMRKDCSFSIIHELRQFTDTLPQFIALSSSKDHTYQAIKNGVFDYLLKPLNYYDLKKCLLKFEKSQPQTASICLKSYTEYRFLPIEDVLYLKADNNTTDFFLKDGSMVTAYSSLKNFEIELPNIFVRIHKSYIVNVHYITKIHFSKFQCTIKFSNKIIPFSKGLKSRMIAIRDFLSTAPTENMGISLT